MFSAKSIFLKKLKLTAIDKDGNALPNIQPFELMLNPESYTVKSTICYTDDQANGNKSGNTQKFSNQPAKEIILDPFIIDITGAVPNTLSPSYKSMKEVIESLEKVIYDIDGKEHRPPLIKLEWGILSYKAQLSSMDVKYTLFDTNGDPLRAQVSLTLKEHLTDEEKAAREQDCSQDLTHLAEVKDGDTLPLMCNRMYKDCSFYQEVAEVNGLDDFHQLIPGTFLKFPPIVD